MKNHNLIISSALIVACAGTALTGKRARMQQLLGSRGHSSSHNTNWRKKKTFKANKRKGV